VPNSEFRTCPDPEFPNALHSEFINMPNVEFLDVPLCSAPTSYLAANGVVRCATGTPQRVGACSEQYTRWLRRVHSIGRGCHVHTCVMAIGADFKMYLLSQFCSNGVEFFIQYIGDTDAKMMDQNFEIRILWFLRIFLKVFKKASPGPSAADLDHYGRGQTRSK